MIDNIECFGNGTVIQHGKLSNRVYLMKLYKEDFPQIVEHINKLAKENQYTKLFCKVPAWGCPLFIINGFKIEASIPRFYNTSEDVFFMSKFLEDSRQSNFEKKKLDTLSDLLVESKSSKTKPTLAKGFSFKSITPSDVKMVTDIYKTVFESYPFPIHEDDYILKTMNGGVQYYGIEKDGKLVALSSAETDVSGQNAEMTDFATLPEFRGKKLSIILLEQMEKEMKKQNITTLYTIARLNSIPMNKTFLNQGYKYSGTLVNNTNISGKIESMNVLYKHV